MAEEYVHRDSAGDSEKCRRIHEETINLLKPFYTTGKIQGFQVLVIRNLEDIEEHLIFSDCAKVSRGLLPFVFSCVERKPSCPIDTDKLMRKKGYERVFCAG